MDDVRRGRRGVDMEQSSTNEKAQLGQGRTNALDLGIVGPLQHLNQAFSGCLPSCPRV